MLKKPNLKCLRSRSSMSNARDLACIMVRYATWSAWSLVAWKILSVAVRVLKKHTKSTCKRIDKFRTKPLKMIMVEAKNQAEMMKPNNFNIDVILDIMRTSQKATLDVQHLNKHRFSILARIKSLPI